MEPQKAPKRGHKSQGWSGRYFGGQANRVAIEQFLPELVPSHPPVKISLESLLITQRSRNSCTGQTRQRPSGGGWSGVGWQRWGGEGAPERRELQINRDRQAGKLHQRVAETRRKTGIPSQGSLPVRLRFPSASALLSSSTGWANS